MSDVMTFSKRTAAGLEEVLRTLLLDSENKVPAERLRIVGALDDGAIIESGSNANGDWVRFADGTQICTMRDVVTSEQNMTMGALFSFPASFVASPKLSANVTTFSSQSNSGAFILEVANVSTTHYSIKMQIVVSGGDIIAPPNNNEFMAIAIGKWK